MLACIYATFSLFIITYSIIFYMSGGHLNHWFLLSVSVLFLKQMRVLLFLDATLIHQRLILGRSFYLLTDLVQRKAGTALTENRIQSRVIKAFLGRGIMRLGWQIPKNSHPNPIYWVLSKHAYKTVKLNLEMFQSWRSRGSNPGPCDWKAKILSTMLPSWSLISHLAKLASMLKEVHTPFFRDG